MTTLRHSDIWSGLDKLAKSQGWSASGLARRSGLDPTAFNKSKRINPQGKPRWPTTESLAKALTATKSTMADFVRLVGAPAGAGAWRQYPTARLASALKPGSYDDAGQPAGGAWSDIGGPDVGDAAAFAIKVTGGDLAPVYRDGALIIVAPSGRPRRGDRVVALARGRIVVREVVRLNKREAELKPVASRRGGAVIAARDLDWIHRIVWASQ